MRLAEIKARRLNGNGIIHGAALEGREKKKRKPLVPTKMAAGGQADNNATLAGAAAVAGASVLMTQGTRRLQEGDKSQGA